MLFNKNLKNIIVSNWKYFCLKTVDQNQSIETIDTSKICCWRQQYALQKKKNCHRVEQLKIRLLWVIEKTRGSKKILKYAKLRCRVGCDQVGGQWNATISVSKRQEQIITVNVSLERLRNYITATYSLIHVNYCLTLTLSLSLSPFWFSLFFIHVYKMHWHLQLPRKQTVVSDQKFETYRSNL